MKSILFGAFALMAASASATWTFDRSTMTATDGSWTVTFVADGENLGIKTGLLYHYAADGATNYGTKESTRLHALQIPVQLKRFHFCRSSLRLQNM